MLPMHALKVMKACRSFGGKGILKETRPSIAGIHTSRSQRSAFENVSALRNHAESIVALHAYWIE